MSKKPRPILYNKILCKMGKTSWTYSRGTVKDDLTRSARVLFCAAFSGQTKHLKHKINIFCDCTHGIYIRWYLRNECGRNELSMLLDLLKAFD